MYRLVGLVLLVISVPVYGTMILKSCRYDARFELEGYPKVGNEFTLTLKVKAVYASPMTQMRMPLPKNVTMLGSDTTWQGSLEPGDSVLLPVHLRIDEIGAYCYTGQFLKNILSYGKGVTHKNSMQRCK